MVQDTINAQIRNICESSAALKDAPKGSARQKIGDFFYTGMDSVSLNRNGIGSLKADLDRIDGIKDIDGIMKAAASIHMVAGSPLFDFWVTQDDRISSKNAIFFAQGGLSLPDRSYYVDMDTRTVMVREKFTAHAANMFRMMGQDEVTAKKSAGQLMKLETALAKAARKRKDTRDPLKNYNKLSFKQFTSETPNLNWPLFMQGAGLQTVDTVIVGQPEFLKALNGYLKSFSLNDWKNYLKFHFLSGLSMYLDDQSYNEMFSFYYTVLRGVKEPKPRWKRVVMQTDGSLGELIGQVYVNEYLPKGTKEKLLEIGNAIKGVYAERMKNLDWMSEATKKKAIEKLNAVIMKVGYPDKWKD